jgi:hypothetical protein
VPINRRPTSTCGTARSKSENPFGALRPINRPANSPVELRVVFPDHHAGHKLGGGKCSFVTLFKLHVGNVAGAASNQPVGILTVGANTAGTYTNNLRSPNVTFGGAASYDAVMRFWGNVEDANIDLDDGTGAFIVSPHVQARWKSIPMAVNFPKYLWEGRHNVGDGLCKCFASKLMDVSLANQVLFGKWSDCLVLQ